MELYKKESLCNRRSFALIGLLLAAQAFLVGDSVGDKKKTPAADML